MFGIIDGNGVVQNLNITEGCVTGVSYAGGIATNNYGTIINSSFSGSVTGVDCVGGIAGVNYGTIIDSSFSGSVTVTSNGYDDGVGGIAGFSYYGTIVRCSNSGAVNGGCAGGIAGRNRANSVIKDCFNIGTVNSSSWAGGITGYNVGGSSVTGCFSTGAVSGTYAGGIAGDSGTIADCCYLEGTAENSIGVGSGSVTNTSGKTAAEFASGEVAWLLNGGSVAEDGTVTEPAGNVWKQDNLGAEGSLPGFAGPDVYRSESCDGVVIYTNDASLAGKKEHVFDENYYCSSCGQQMVARVSAGGAAIYYADIQNAWAAAKECGSAKIPAVVTLVADAVVTETLTVEGGDSIFLTCVSGKECTISSSTEGTVSNIITVSGGSFELAGGVVSNSAGNGISVSGGAFSMTGGAVKATINETVICYGIAVSDGEASLSGGTVNGRTYGLYVTGGEISVGGSSAITGGERRVNGVNGGTGISMYGGTVVISGGQITGIFSQNSAGYGVYVEDGTLAVSGGNIRGESYGLRVTDRNYSITLSGGIIEGEVYHIWTANGVVSNFLAQGCYYYNENGAQLTGDGRSFRSDGYVTVKNPGAEVVSVDVTWGSLDFTYTDGGWNPETHTYGDGGWRASDEGGDKITVANTGEAEVSVSYRYRQINTAFSGSFADAAGNALESSVSLASGEETEAILSLEGKPRTGLDADILGQVTVTIGGE